MRKLSIIVVVSVAFFLIGCGSLSRKDVSYYKDGRLLYSPELLKNSMYEPNLVIIDVRKRGFDKGHIPLAVNFPLNELETILTDIIKIRKIVGDKGISGDSKIIIYGDNDTKNSVASLYWIMKYAGAHDVNILNGGIEAWRRCGFKVSNDMKKYEKKIFKSNINEKMIIGTEDLIPSLNGGNYVLIDSRNDEEYNGWALNGVKGGHIPGAVHFPARWIYDDRGRILDPVKLKTLFEKKKITKDKKIIVYANKGKRSSSVFLALNLLGYENVSNYTGSVNEWISKKGNKLDKLKRYEKIVSAEWVKKLIDGDRPLTYHGNKFVVLEARYMSSTTTKANADPEKIYYIPGAVSIHPCYLEHKYNKAKYYPKYSEPKDGNLLPLSELKEAVEDLGISKDTTVVVYGSGVITPMTAARVAWALMYAGVEDVRILNGGYKAWLKEGFPVAETPAKPVKVDFGGDVPGHPEYLATMEYVRGISGGKNIQSVMVDVRREEETCGNLNPYPFFTKTGKIPGAIWTGNWVDLVDMNDDTFRSYSEISDLWNKLKITKDKEPVFYCGTGWRSSIGFFTAYVMGYSKMRNYDGSFYQWSWYSENSLKDK